ncbi:uncharacterized protein LOC129586962 isoform X2 [Paramacrobiotus metropolitanus]|uniref:uncharacterized protein LOC129586962 isoform X2 n=1 Tax=Paramacrobiotus metropolitanus TaxID=2943436 RepID=UPI0024457407|nr:uncharacterized protein LOC129586962 isoform X2 [Paramacrobiotus metropolitanus]
MGSRSGSSFVPDRGDFEIYGLENVFSQRELEELGGSGDYRFALVVGDAGEKINASSRKGKGSGASLRKGSFATGSPGKERIAKHIKEVCDDTNGIVNEIDQVKTAYEQVKKGASKGFTETNDVFTSGLKNLRNSVTNVNGHLHRLLHFLENQAAATYHQRASKLESSKETSRCALCEEQNKRYVTPSGDERIKDGRKRETFQFPFLLRTLQDNSCRFHPTTRATNGQNKHGGPTSHHWNQEELPPNHHQLSNGNTRNTANSSSREWRSSDNPLSNAASFSGQISYSSAYSDHSSKESIFSRPTKGNGHSHPSPVYKASHQSISKNSPSHVDRSSQTERAEPESIPRNQPPEVLKKCRICNDPDYYETENNPEERRGKRYRNRRRSRRRHSADAALTRDVSETNMFPLPHESYSSVEETDMTPTKPAHTVEEADAKSDVQITSERSDSSVRLNTYASFERPESPESVTEYPASLSTVSVHDNAAEGHVLDDRSASRSSIKSKEKPTQASSSVAASDGARSVRKQSVQGVQLLQGDASKSHSETEYASSDHDRIMQTPKPKSFQSYGDTNVADERSDDVDQHSDRKAGNSRSQTAPDSGAMFQRSNRSSPDYERINTHSRRIVEPERGSNGVDDFEESLGEPAHGSHKRSKNPSDRNPELSRNTKDQHNPARNSQDEYMPTIPSTTDTSHNLNSLLETFQRYLNQLQNLLQTGFSSPGDADSVSRKLTKSATIFPVRRSTSIVTRKRHLSQIPDNLDRQAEVVASLEALCTKAELLMEKALDLLKSPQKGEKRANKQEHLRTVDSVSQVYENQLRFQAGTESMQREFRSLKNAIRDLTAKLGTANMPLDQTESNASMAGVEEALFSLNKIQQKLFEELLLLRKQTAKLHPNSAKEHKGERIVNPRRSVSADYSPRQDRSHATTPNEQSLPRERQRSSSIQPPNTEAGTALGHEFRKLRKELIRKLETGSSKAKPVKSECAACQKMAQRLQSIEKKMKGAASSNSRDCEKIIGKLRRLDKRFEQPVHVDCSHCKKLPFQLQKMEELLLATIRGRPSRIPNTENRKPNRSKRLHRQHKPVVDAGRSIGNSIHCPTCNALRQFNKAHRKSSNAQSPFKFQANQVVRKLNTIGAELRGLVDKSANRAHEERIMIDRKSQEGIERLLSRLDELKELYTTAKTKPDRLQPNSALYKGRNPVRMRGITNKALFRDSNPVSASSEVRKQRKILMQILNAIKQSKSVRMESLDKLVEMLRPALKTFYQKSVPLSRAELKGQPKKTSDLKQPAGFDDCLNRLSACQAENSELKEKFASLINKLDTVQTESEASADKLKPLPVMSEDRLQACLKKYAVCRAENERIKQRNENLHDKITQLQTEFQDKLERETEKRKLLERQAAKLYTKRPTRLSGSNKNRSIRKIPISKKPRPSSSSSVSLVPREDRNEILKILKAIQDCVKSSTTGSRKTGSRKIEDIAATSIPNRQEDRAERIALKIQDQLSELVVAVAGQNQALIQLRETIKTLRISSRPYGDPTTTQSGYNTYKLNGSAPNEREKRQTTLEIPQNAEIRIKNLEQTIQKQEEEICQLNEMINELQRSQYRASGTPRFSLEERLKQIREAHDRREALNNRGRSDFEQTPFKSDKHLQTRRDLQDVRNGTDESRHHFDEKGDSRNVRNNEDVKFSEAQFMKDDQLAKLHFDVEELKRQLRHTQRHDAVHKNQEPIDRNVHFVKSSELDDGTVSRRAARATSTDDLRPTKPIVTSKSTDTSGLTTPAGENAQDPPTAVPNQGNVGVFPNVPTTISTGVSPNTGVKPGVNTTSDVNEQVQGQIFLPNADAEHSRSSLTTVKDSSPADASDTNSTYCDSLPSRTLSQRIASAVRLCKSSSAVEGIPRNTDRKPFSSDGSDSLFINRRPCQVDPLRGVRQPKPHPCDLPTRTELEHMGIQSLLSKATDLSSCLKRLNEQDFVDYGDDINFCTIYSDYLSFAELPIERL